MIGVIGAGGMGSVYKVQHLISDRVEAMKVVLPELIDTAELAERFIREIRVQARLSHPNIASLHNALRIDNQLVMVMEYVDGSTLHALLKQGRLETPFSIEVILQVLEALAYAHSQGIVHRDIKPANIMFTGSGVVKLMDFGIARSRTDQQLTQAGAAIGSVYYMSPEQVQGAAIDGRSDLYSVGVMLYEMVTGKRPIAGDSSWAVMNAHLTQLPQPPLLVNPDLSNSFSTAILRAIEKNPAHRYQSAEEFGEALRLVRGARPPITPGHMAETLARVPKTPEPQRPASQTPTGAPSSTPISPSDSAFKRFDPAELDRLKKELAAHVGPMARVIVDRAAKKAANRQQLYQLLAPEIDNEDARKKFLGGLATKFK